MKEVLFRGRTEDGKWAYGSLICADEYCCILESEDNVHPMDYPYLDGELGTFDGKATPIVPGTVGQYIGLCDISNNKIFEGDILENESLSGKTEYFLIGYDGASFTYCTPKELRLGIATSIDDNEYGIITGYYKVIGNIHDDPEIFVEGTA